jgi:phospholipase/carboxylesterase
VRFALLLSLVAGCAAGVKVSPQHKNGIVSARPHAPAPGAPLAAGLRDFHGALLYVPEGLDPARPPPLVVALHGSGGRAEGIVRRFRPLADQHKVILLAPRAREHTWDLIAHQSFGGDLEAIDTLLEAFFAEVTVDPERVAVAGFSDGGSYSLCMGLGNGALFRGIVALAPGFAYSTRIEGRPRVLIVHGVYDERLPIDTASRRIVPALRRAGLTVEYVELEIEHRLTPEVLAQVSTWLAAFVR